MDKGLIYIEFRKLVGRQVRYIYFFADLANLREAHMNSISTYVINLDRRPDRMHRIGTGLIAAKVPFERLPAIDCESSQFVVENLTFPGKGLAANWISHQEVYKKILKSSSDFALVLEDDADISNSKSFSPNQLQKWVSMMKQNQIDLLQVGYISSIYRLTTLRGLLELALAARARRLVLSGDRLSTHVLGEFRAGAHAYLINRRVAAALVGLNMPPALSSDGFLDVIARNCGQSSFQFGRLFYSAIEQESRVSGSQEIDSDV
jgi:hypothetical protein